MNIVFVYILMALITLLFLSMYLISRKEKRDLTKLLNEMRSAINEQIRFSIEPKLIDAPAAKDLIELAIDVWRLENRLSKCISDIPENKVTGLLNAFQKLKKYLSRCDIEIIDYTGQKFNDGLNLDVLSVERDPGSNHPTVKETVEPTVMCKGSVLKKAKIILCTA